MRIKFNGVLEKKNGGCSACGKKSKSSYGFTNSKLYHMASGRSQVFRTGEVYEVSDIDGNFLLQYNDMPDANGLSRKIFEVV